MDKRSNKDPSVNSETPAIAKGLIDLACVLARHAARELIASLPAPPLCEEHADD